MKQHIYNLKLEDLNSDWLIELIRDKFNKENETITPFRVLSKTGIHEGDQLNQLKFKTYRIRIKRLLKKLKEENIIVQKPNLHETKGIKEIGYLKNRDFF